MRKVKTFTDLVFNPHAFSKEARHLPSPLREEYMEAKHAVMRFDNGYGISVVKGDMFYSNMRLLSLKMVLFVMIPQLQMM